MLAVASRHKDMRLGLAYLCAILESSQQSSQVKSDCEKWYNWGMPETSLNRLPGDYEITDVCAVRSFVMSNPQLHPVIWDAPAHVRDMFPEADLELEMSADPESETEHLVLWVRCRLNPDESIQRLLDLTRTWWGEARRQVRGKLSICLV